MGSTLSTDATWSLGLVAGSNTSNGQVIELCGASNRIEAAYQKWLARLSSSSSSNSNSNMSLAQHPSPDLMSPTQTAVSKTNAELKDGADERLVLTFSITTHSYQALQRRQQTSQAVDTSASTIPGTLFVQLEVHFSDMTARLHPPLSCGSSITQMRSASFSSAAAASTAITTIATASQPCPAAMTAAGSTVVLPMGAHPPWLLLRNGAPPPIPTERTIPKRRATRLPQWAWLGGGHFHDYTQPQRRRLEKAYQAFLSARTTYNLALVNSTTSKTVPTSDEFVDRLAAYNRAREVTLMVNRHKYAFDFEAMKQRNVNSGRLRDIRRVDPNVANANSNDGGGDGVSQQHQQRQRQQQQPVMRDGNNAAALAKLSELGENGMVPIWKWESNHGRGDFEPYSLAVCVQLEEAHRYVWERAKKLFPDSCDDTKRSGSEFASPIDPRLLRRAIWMYTRPTSKRTTKYIFSFESNHFKQITARSLRSRKVVRTLVPRAAVLPLAQLGAQPAAGAPAAHTQNVTTSESRAATAETELVMASEETLAAVTTSTGVEAKTSGASAAPLGLSPAAAAARSRIAIEWGCEPILDSANTLVAVTPTAASDSVIAATTATESLSLAAAQTTSAATVGPSGKAKWQHSSMRGTAWHDIDDTFSDAIECAYQNHLATLSAAESSGGNAATEKPTVSLGWRSQRYYMDFADGVQINQRSRGKRRIRRQVLPSSPSPLQQSGTAAKAPISTATATTAGRTPVRAAVTDVSAEVERAREREAEASATAAREDALPYGGHGDVDRHAPSDLIARCSVHANRSGDLYTCMLNKADIRANHNKFYFIQLLRTKDNADEFHLYARWGRVGHVGQVSSQKIDGVKAAEAAFERTFSSKTHQRWENRADSQLVKGHYMVMRIGNRSEEDREAEDGPFSTDHNTGNSTDATAGYRVAIRQPQVVELQSTLHPLVHSLMKYITDRQDMSNVVSGDFSLDVKRMPLGHITKAQIKDAFSVLTQIEKAIASTTPVSDRELVDLSNMFYTLLPHTVSTHARLPVIDNAMLLQNKIDLVQTLGDIEIANEIMKMAKMTPQQREQQLRGGKPIEVPNRMDKVYESLQCSLTPLDMSNDPIVERIKLYALLTRGETHSLVPEVTQVFAVNRPQEDARWQQLCEATKSLDYPGPQTNVRMLWHGSRKTNFLGILSQGLRIAPPEAPSTGYMFGKGIYFADVVSKASGYCHPINNEGIMLLSEVGLGKMLELGSSQFMLKARPGYGSTKGVGSMAPRGREVHDGVIWPIGRVQKQQHPHIKKTSLYYPEYIIYDPAQYRMKYLIRMSFRRA